jgi:hypothetical protein
MSDKKQSSVDFILNAFNLLSDSDFKAWMLNNHDEIKAIHKKEIKDAWMNSLTKGDYHSSEEYYNETFGGSHE